ncbi:MAG TPA: tRNA lysidine(34) synthetase TilS [Opitutae bacterium]|nr:tRNA lysidine(34) synthetase TilS [Puniceicoccaceae bacterium]HBR92925.1 tRNA lysidine(34) synthetase TilS [Opitutae bacterium]HCY27232.1 tRNA lysidine(34) synthetase TilS [Alteromonas macleodii]|tara:strand:- start:12806 stop:14260 length:1455 start_codon:yes stop_codon:yes gene_type:complete
MQQPPQLIDWPSCALAIQRRFGDTAIEPSVLAHLQAASRVLVACSGGADSVFMLCILVAQAQTLGVEIHVAHYNHRWRAEDSDADAAFVESLADAFELPFHSDIRPDYEAAFTETTTRALRLEFLRKVAKEQSCRYIAFGHQLDDILETQLQRIVRGCASDGLAAPRPVSVFTGHPTHLRPLLHLRAVDVRMALNVSSAVWREDSSNADVSIARNALRQEIIPDLAQALGRDPATGAARTRRLLEEDAAALDQLAREYLPQAYAHADSLDRFALRAVPTALLRRALAEWLNGHGLIRSVGAPAMDILIETLCSHRERYRMSAGSHYLVLDSQTLRWEHEDATAQLDALRPTVLGLGEAAFLSTGALIEAEVIDLSPALLQKIEAGDIDPRTEAMLRYDGELAFQVRSWQPGDRFYPLGAPGGKKLKSCFIDRRIPQLERKTLPLVLNASQEIIWVPGFPPAESYKICPATKKALRLTYQIRKPL